MPASELCSQRMPRSADGAPLSLSRPSPPAHCAGGAGSVVRGHSIIPPPPGRPHCSGACPQLGLGVWFILLSAPQRRPQIATSLQGTAALTCGLLTSSATLHPSHDIAWFVGSTVEFLPLAAGPGDQQCDPKALGEFPKLSDCRIAGASGMAC